MKLRPTIWKQGDGVFSVRAPHARAVFLAGTFNGWSTTSHPMQRGQSGVWTLKLDLPAGEYEYKFVIDGEWCCEPGCDEPYDGCAACVPNAFGTMNRTLAVTDHRSRGGALSSSRPKCQDGSLEGQGGSAR